MPSRDGASSREQSVAGHSCARIAGCSNGPAQSHAAQHVVIVSPRNRGGRFLRRGVDGDVPRHYRKEPAYFAATGRFPQATRKERCGLSSSLTEIRWHGRGGQGAVTAAKMVAEIAAEHGRCFQAFPEYGPERSGAPIVAFTRLSDSPIQCYSAIEHPSIILVLDETLLPVVDVTEGAPPDTAVIVNTEKSPEELKKRFDFGGRKVYTVPATRIAKQTLGRAIPNTPMVSALARVTGEFNLEEIISHLRHTFGKKFPQKVVDANIEAARLGFEEVRE